MRRTLLLVGAVVVAVVLASGASGSAVSGQAHWVISDLGLLEQVGLNERGQVAGTLMLKSGPYSVRRAVVWENGRRRDLGFLRSLGCGSDMPGMSFATGINDAGWVVGQSYCEANAPSYYPFVWQRGKMIDLGSGGVYFNSWSGPVINDRGQVAVGTEGSGFLWQNGKRRRLATVPGRPYNEIVAVNNRSEVIGNGYPREDAYQEFAGASHGFIVQNGKAVDLGTLGEKESGVVALNERGQVAGLSYNAGADFRVVASRAFVWDGGRKVVLTGLGGKKVIPTDINDEGQIVGSSGTGQGSTHAFLWQNGHTTDLGTLVGGKSSSAAAISEDGKVVGSSATTGGWGHAFIWDGSTMTDLGTLPVGKSSGATGTNDHGQVVGWATTKNGQRHAVLWTLRRG